MPKVDYQVEITRTGQVNALPQTAAELNQVAVAATNAGRAVNASSAAANANHYSGLNQGVQASSKSLTALKNAAQVIGFTVFPRLAGSIMVGTTSMSALRAVAISTGAGLATVSAAGVVLTATIGTATAGIQSYLASKKELDSFNNLVSTQVDLVDRLSQQLTKLRAEGKLTAEEFDRLSAKLKAPSSPPASWFQNWVNTSSVLPDWSFGMADKPWNFSPWDIPQGGIRPDAQASGIKEVQKAIRPLIGVDSTQDQKSKIEEIRRLGAQFNLETLEGEEKARAAAGETFDQRIQQINKLRAAFDAFKNLISDPDRSAGQMWIDRAPGLALAAFNKAKADAAEAAQKITRDRLEQEREAEIQAADEIGAIREGLALDMLSGTERQIVAITRQYDLELQKIAEVADAAGLSAQQQIELRERVAQARGVQLQQARDAQWGIQSLDQMGLQTAQHFASSFAGAFTAFADGTKSAKEAFTDFARSVLDQITQMIIQTLVLKSIQGIAGSFSGGAGAGATAMAGGGMVGLGGVQFAANGIQTVSRPTYFPSFNVLAGEAGAEVMTVMARPRKLALGGMEAMVGNVGSKRMAITDADQLANNFSGGGISGSAVIEVRPAPGYEARLLEDAIQGASVKIVNDMARDTELSRATRRLTA